MYKDPLTGEQKNGIATVRWHHDHVIDFMIANPTVSQAQIAKEFGFREHWVSLMVNSDAFKARLAERKAELVDPIIVRTVEERLHAVAAASLDRVLEKLVGPLPPDDKFVLESAKLATAALGYGARPAGGKTDVNIGVVVQVPGKLSEGDWRAKYSPGDAQAISDATPVPSPPAGK